jgi:glucose-6-phosphate isomerase
MADHHRTPFTPPTHTASWQHLARLAQQPQPHLRELLSQANPQRNTRLQAEGAGLRLDATRQCVTPEVLDGLLALAAERGVHEQALALRRGDPINATENRPVLHVALRGGGLDNPPWGATVAGQVQTELGRFLAAAERLRNGLWLGHSGEAITDVVNIGIGGSDLGPRMAVQALDAWTSPKVKVHFVSNLDGWALHATLRQLNPHRTAFVVQSKTFTTQETLTIAASARQWLANGGCSGAAQAAHLLAVTAAPQQAALQGFQANNTFGFWDWVGGRYSVWSAIGLPLAIAIGADAFKAFLAGGHAMDRHFWETEPSRNLPLLMALLGVWNRNFLGCPTQLVSVYSWRMAHLAPFLQQMDMESNGKSTHVNGQAATVDTGAIVWGGLGIDAQHAYFQLLHQGRQRVPIDFIGVETDDCPLPMAAEHHRLVKLNMQAQAQALALGRDEAATRADMATGGVAPHTIDALAPHRSYRGNVPSSSLWLPELSPRTLGCLVALYEHKVFCQAAIWGIHAYDQWGVELGKTMARELERATPPT